MSTASLRRAPASDRPKIRANRASSGYRYFGKTQSKLTISTQLAPLPAGYLSRNLSAPLAWSIAYTEIVSDFSPVATRNLPLGSIANPRGWRTVGVLDR